MIRLLGRRSEETGHWIPMQVDLEVGNYPVGEPMVKGVTQFVHVDTEIIDAIWLADVIRERARV